MSDLNIPLKESYINKVADALVPYTADLKAKNYDPTSRIAELKGAGPAIEQAGRDRKKAEKALADAVKAEQTVRAHYYDLATTTVSLVEGALADKSHELIVKLRSLRADLIGNQHPDGNPPSGPVPPAK